MIFEMRIENSRILNVRRVPCFDNSSCRVAAHLGFFICCLGLSNPTHLHLLHFSRGRESKMANPTVGQPASEVPVEEPASESDDDKVIETSPSDRWEKHKKEVSSFPSHYL